MSAAGVTPGRINLARHLIHLELPEPARVIVLETFDALLRQLEELRPAVAHTDGLVAVRLSPEEIERLGALLNEGRPERFEITHPTDGPF